MEAVLGDFDASVTNRTRELAHSNRSGAMSGLRALRTALLDEYKDFIRATVSSPASSSSSSADADAPASSASAGRADLPRCPCCLAPPGTRPGPGGSMPLLLPSSGGSKAPCLGSAGASGRAHRQPAQHSCGRNSYSYSSTRTAVHACSQISRRGARRSNVYDTAVPTGLFGQDDG